MTPYLLLRTTDYETALKQASKMMANRGFDTLGDDALRKSECDRALQYIEQVYQYFFNWMFPVLTIQMKALADLGSENRTLYLDCIDSISGIESALKEERFREIIIEDPRHLFLMASSRKYPNVFNGYRGTRMDVPSSWQKFACSILKMGHLVRAIEEDSQDINDYAQLGLFLEMEGQSLHDLFNYAWDDPKSLPASESAQKAYVKIAAFFQKLNESLVPGSGGEGLVFDSGDGVEVEIVEIKSRLKSPESMFTKLGKDLEGEAYEIRDVLAITFLLSDRDDTLKLFHALQKRGVILQENTLSHSITQTLFDGPEDMIEAIRRLVISLARSEGRDTIPDDREMLDQARSFFESLSMNASRNPYTSLGHRKFQCKINYSLPIHRAKDTNKILIPGTADYARRNEFDKRTQQHTLALELRISDVESWRMSEYMGDSHHDAYKFRQLISVMNRVFKGIFAFPDQNIQQLRKDQSRLFG
jgi:uncharacterized protein (TIGR04562 family)